MPSEKSDNRLVVLLLVSIGVLVVVPLFGMGVGMGGFGHVGGGIWGGGALPIWPFLVAVVMQIAFLVIVVLGAYLLYRAVIGEKDTSDRALEELRQAYARGELTDEEFDRRREKLRRDRE